MNDPNDQIAGEAASVIAGTLNLDEKQQPGLKLIIKSAIEKAYAEGKAVGYRQGKITRAAQASEPPFDQSKHHPSCTPNDQDLGWHCHQCGHWEWPRAAQVSVDEYEKGYAAGWEACDREREISEQKGGETTK